MDDTAGENAVAVAASESATGDSQASVPVEEQLKRLEEKEHRARKRRPGSFWNKPPTYVYADNFGFGVQSYQSMIDYLDEKDHGGKPNKDEVHLPMLEERCMKKFDPRKPFRRYKNCEIDEYIDKGENIRAKIRQNDTLGLSNVLRRTHTNWSMTRKFVQLVKNSYVVDYRKLHKKGHEFEDYEDYRSTSPLPVVNYREVSPQPQFVDYSYRELTPRPRYVDDLSAEFASVLSTLSQSRMEHEKELETRRERMRMLDSKFEEVVGQMYDKMSRINERADSIIREHPEPRNIEAAVADGLTLRNRVRREDDVRRMMECVNELTDMNSARNQLRMCLRNLDDEMHGFGSRAGDVQDVYHKEAQDDTDGTAALDMLRSSLAARRARSQSLPRSVVPEEEEEELFVKSCRKPKKALIFPKHERITTRPKHPLLKDELLSDVHARVLNKAGEIGSRTSECRRISSRARFVNVFKPRPDTCDYDLIVEPSKVEMNIDYMAKTLAMRGACQRRWGVDDEGDRPVSNINTNAIKDYRELRARKPIEQHPSISNRVRYATMRARNRTTLLGY
ncbi:uncharacterized protein LOC122249256 [Penaeus japonicus]|uniref:uncharacterized protein LOC122249256 n=1 Tax=Penaeus japonicus TaxID=27405 RepID=UPI001C717B60|nr:uncharacterized protein LOC122249256 [Penaeus japonicus]